MSKRKTAPGKAAPRSRRDGRARRFFHPSQLPVPNAVRRRPAFILRAPPALVAGLTRSAAALGISRNTLLVQIMAAAIRRASAVPS